MPEEMTDDKQDASVCRAVVLDMVKALDSGPRTRYRALAVTHLQIAANFLRNAMEEEHA